MREVFTNEAEAEAALAAIVARFRDDVTKAATEALGQVETDYLPHLTTDLWLNVRTYARAMVEDYLAGRDDSVGSLAMAHDVRMRLYNEHKDDLVAKLKEDLAFAQLHMRERFAEWWEFAIIERGRP